MILTHDSSFERLYKAAFLTSEPFWIKGSTLAGNEFVETALLPENWQILGHLNGNAICTLQVIDSCGEGENLKPGLGQITGTKSNVIIFPRN